MEIRLHQSEALSLAGLAAAASKDRARPILTGFQFRFEPATDEVNKTKVTVTATDSYRLGQHVLGIEGTVEAPFDVLFDGNQIGAGLKKARTKGSTAILTFDPEEGPMDIRVFANSGNFSCEAQRIDGTFPKWGNLLDPIPWDEDWTSYRHPEPEEEEEEQPEVGPRNYVEPPLTPAGAFNPTYLGQMAEILGLKGSAIPVQVLVNGPRKPAAFKRVEQGEIVARAILMPVRI